MPAFTATQNALTPLSNSGPSIDNIFNPDWWSRDRSGANGDASVENAIDSGRHFGALGNAALLPFFKNQLGQVGAAVQNQNFARGGLNALLTPQGRQQQVASVANANTRQAYKTGAKIRALMAARGQDVGGAAELGALNQAASRTQDYAAALESPEGLQQIYQAVTQANDPMQVLSILGPMIGLDQQDLPRALEYFRRAAAEKASGGLGGLLGAFGQLAGLAGGGSNPLSALGGLLGGGGGDASSNGWQTQVS
jgi:hypothetical protein